MFKATNEQSDIIQEIVNGNSDVVVEAGPGSGKTTTILEAMKLLPSSAKILYLCFNSRNAEEAKGKVPSNVDACTLNSMGYRITRNYIRAKVNKFKTQNRLQEYLGAKWNKSTKAVEFENKDSEKLYYQSVNIVCRMVALMKGDCIYGNKITADTVIDMLVAYQIVCHCVDAETLVNLIITIYKICLADVKEIDFDDQIAFPVKNGWKIKADYDYIFVDEAQDLNLAQFKLVESLVA